MKFSEDAYKPYFLSFKNFGINNYRYANYNLIYQNQNKSFVNFCVHNYCIQSRIKRSPVVAICVPFRVSD